MKQITTFLLTLAFCLPLTPAAHASILGITLPWKEQESWEHMDESQIHSTKLEIANRINVSRLSRAITPVYLDETLNTEAQSLADSLAYNTDPATIPTDNTSSQKVITVQENPKLATNVSSPAFLAYHPESQIGVGLTQVPDGADYVIVILFK